MDDDTTTRLLRMAGPRPGVGAARAEEIRRAVHVEWQAATAGRVVRRRTIVASALLAVAAVLALVFRLTTTPSSLGLPGGPTIATVERVDGMLALAPGAGLHAGRWIETGGTSRAALRLASGASVRLDTATRARLLSSTVVELTAGAIYLDTGASSAGLEVRTPLGTAHDIGTQFEVRLREASLQVRVRSGLVELQHGGGLTPAAAGTAVTLTGGVATVIPAAPHGAVWEWAAALAPAFEIEGRPLAAFLDHLAREQGWTLRYADAALSRTASTIVLHGSVNGLPPREALAVVLATSGLAHRFQDGDLFVFKP